jgi:hypothetical protein
MRLNLPPQSQQVNSYRLISLNFSDLSLAYLSY